MPNLAAIEKAKKVLELQKAMAEKLKNLPKKPAVVPPGASAAPPPAAVPAVEYVPTKEEEWRLARRAQKKRVPRALDFIDPGRYQLQAEFNRAVASGKTEEEAAEAVREKRMELKDERRQAARAERAELRRQQEEAERAERVRVGEEKRREVEERLRQQRVEVPGVEWWDARIIAEGRGYDDAVTTSAEAVRWDRVTHYVEHPVPVEPPAEGVAPPPQPLKMTQREMKKLRTQRRLAREKERQELIKQGVLEPPAPKVKISNLHRVLGAEAAADPTAVEREVRRQMAEREAAHRDRNVERMLSPEARREKKIRKMFDDAPETQVAVFRVESLANTRSRFKVEINAQQNELTGRAIMGPRGTGLPFCLVAVEGCLKSVKRFSKLMLHRIDWGEVLEKEDPEEQELLRREAEGNGCRLVWQGTVLEPAWDRFQAVDVESEQVALGTLRQVACEHYWTLARESRADE